MTIDLIAGTSGGWSDQMSVTTIDYIQPRTSEVAFIALATAHRFATARATVVEALPVVM